MAAFLLPDTVTWIKGWTPAATHTDTAGNRKEVVVMSLPAPSLMWIIGIGLGVVCLIWIVRHVTQRKPEPSVEASDSYLDQTCELNYDPDDS